MKYRTIRRGALLASVAMFTWACGNADVEDSVAADNGSTDSGDASAASNEDPDEVTLSAVTSFPRGATEHEGFWLWVDAVEEELPWVSIDYRGGPDVIDPLQQIDALGDGAVDVATMPEPYYVAQAPAADVMKFSPYLPMDERDNGLFDIYQDLHADQLGVHYLGKVYAGVPALIHLREAVDQPDLSGMTIRASAAQAPAVEGLGGSVVNLPAGEVFTALERGTVDGFAWSSVGSVANSWHEVVSYEVAPRFYETFIPVMINLDVWNGLDETTQQELERVTAELEPSIVELYGDLARQEVEAYREAGVELIEFTGNDEATVLQAAYESGWAALDWDAIVQSFPAAEQMREVYESGYGDNYETAVPGGRLIESGSR